MPQAPETAPADAPDDSIDISVVVPVCDEVENLPHLHAALVPVLEEFGRSWEVIYCDDGSTDGSVECARELATADPRVHVVVLSRNFGQTAALAAGFDHARGEIVVPMDADLQNDPHDIPALIERLDEGYDLVSGWRADRVDSFFGVTLPSRIGNAVIRRFTGVDLHDFGCTLTAYRRKLIAELNLYGEMHRFIPAWAVSVGARVSEMKVRHHPRVRGRSKYNLGKAFRVILDLITVVFLVSYRTKPLYFFGRLSFTCGLAAVLSWVWTFIKKAIWGDPITTDPFFVVGLFLALAGLQFIFFGLIAEMQMRTYYESQGKRIYSVRERVNLPAPEPRSARDDHRSRWAG